LFLEVQAAALIKIQDLGRHLQGLLVEDGRFPGQTVVMLRGATGALRGYGVG
jgi:hypothetical protein